MTQAEARSTLHQPEGIFCCHYRGGNARQRRKELREYIRELAHLMSITAA